MPQKPPAAPCELVLEISAAPERRLKVRPKGLGRPAQIFTIEPVLTPEDERQFREYIDGLGRRGATQSRASQHVAQWMEPLGERYYRALFEKQPRLRSWLEARLAAGHGRLVIASDAQEVLRELWETLRPPNKQPLALQGIVISRRLLSVPAKAAAAALGPSLRVLWVAPRPASLGPSEAASGVMRIQSLLDPDAITVLRPPTLQRMKAQLDGGREDGSPFQLVHFEGHGSYLSEEGRGVLYFEDSKGGADPVAGDRLRLAFQEVPLVLLEACYASDTGGPEECWAAVVPHLLHHGVQAVIAAPFSVHVDQMARFVPAFYKSLLGGETVGQAVNAGRRALLVEPGRRTAAGESVSVGLLDWWAMQLYQQGPDAPLLKLQAADERPAAALKPSGGPLTDFSAGVSAAWSRRRFGALAVVLFAVAIAGIGWHSVSHIRDEHHRRERAAARSAIEEEAKRCFNPNAFHCASMLHLAEDCYGRQLPGLWPACSYWIGRIKEDGLTGQPDLPSALAAYGHACDAGYALGCLNSGHMKEHGRGLPQPAALEARRDYERGCELGNLEACANAALLYAKDDPALGLTSNWEQAQPLYARACKGGKGIPSGCVGLGSWLWEKRGDIQGAYRLFSLACAQNDLFGCTRQGDITTHLAERQEAYRKACDVLDNRHGACAGCIPLAKAYEKEPGKEQAAFALYEELCHSGCSGSGSRSCCSDPAVRGTACRWLGWVFEHGELRRSVNLKAARRAYQQGCDSHDKQSCTLLERLSCASAGPHLQSSAGR